MLDRAAPRGRADVLQQPELVQGAHVVGDRAERAPSFFDSCTGEEISSSSIARMRTRSGCPAP
jgi:hypothetical protein